MMTRGQTKDIYPSATDCPVDGQEIPVFPANRHDAEEVNLPHQGPRSKVIENGSG